MTKIFKSLLSKKKKGPSPEEVEALDRATKVLQWRVETDHPGPARRNGPEAGRLSVRIVHTTAKNGHLRFAGRGAKASPMTLPNDISITPNWSRAMGSSLTNTTASSGFSGASRR